MRRSTLPTGAAKKARNYTGGNSIEKGLDERRLVYTNP